MSRKTEEPRSNGPEGLGGTTLVPRAHLNSYSAPGYQDPYTTRHFGSCVASAFCSGIATLGGIWGSKAICLLLTLLNLLNLHVAFLT